MNLFTCTHIVDIKKRKKRNIRMRQPDFRKGGLKNLDEYLVLVRIMKKSTLDNKENMIHIIKSVSQNVKPGTYVHPFKLLYPISTKR